MPWLLEWILNFKLIPVYVFNPFKCRGEQIKGQLQTQVSLSSFSSNPRPSRTSSFCYFSSHALRLHLLSPLLLPLLLSPIAYSSSERMASMFKTNLELILTVFKLIVVIFVGADRHRKLIVAIIVVVIDGDIGDMEGPEAAEVEANCPESSEELHDLIVWFT